MARKPTSQPPAVDEPDAPPADPAVDERPGPAEPPTGPDAGEQVPVASVATEPGCAHPDCVLAHPHAGPAILDEAAVDVDQEQALRRLADARAELEAATAAALPAGGYVIATTALHVAGGARAHLPGDRVPVGNVARNGWEHLVRPPEPGE